MKDNREIGFDILENADLNQIEEFAMDSNMLDDETKKRIKNIIDKKCMEAKGETFMDNKNFIRNTNDENTVSHVEIYKERKITKIISAVVSVAAVFGIVAGGAAFIRNNKVKPEDVTKSSSSLESELDLEVSTEIEEAAQETLNYLLIDMQQLELKYDYIDITGDSTPELFVSKDFYDGRKFLMVYKYNGSEFESCYRCDYQKLAVSKENNAIVLVSEESYYDIIFYDFEPDKEKVLLTSEDTEKIFNQYKNYDSTHCRIYEGESDEFGFYHTEIAGDSSGKEYAFEFELQSISEEEYNQAMDKYDSYGWTEFKIDKYTAKAEKTTQEKAAEFTLEYFADERLDATEFDYKLMDFIGDSQPELFILVKTDDSTFPAELYYGEFDGYFYNMRCLSSVGRVMISEKNKAISCINDNSVFEEYDSYLIDLYDFAPDETKIKADGEIIFNQYENYKFTSIEYYTQYEDGFFNTETGYLSGPSLDNPDGPIKFEYTEYRYNEDIEDIEDTDYSKELFIEKMNEYDSYGWTEMKFDEYKLK